MKVLVIGSGPDRDRRGRRVRLRGHPSVQELEGEVLVVLINSNPATIMTDPGVSDALYIEPLTPEFCGSNVIAREQ
ncbi:MAG: hypothetical protein U0S12_12305 [Fimbriimonadales bacterium]